MRRKYKDIFQIIEDIVKYKLTNDLFIFIFKVDSNSLPVVSQKEWELMIKKDESNPGSLLSFFHYIQELI